ncbi:MAG: hypothetical protein ACPGR2_11740 [Psychrobium sp.]
MSNRSQSTYIRPPILACGFLSWALPCEIKEPVLGDLEEAFATKLQQQGVLSANLWYIRQALLSGSTFMFKTQGSVIMFMFAMVFMLAIFLFAMSMTSGVFFFVDVPSFILIVPPTLVLTCAISSWKNIKAGFAMLFDSHGSFSAKEVESAAQMFVVLGNLGLMLGGLMTLIGFMAIGELIDSVDALGPSVSIVLISLFYGGVIKLFGYVAQQRIQASCLAKEN